MNKHFRVSQSAPMDRQPPSHRQSARIAGVRGLVGFKGARKAKAPSRRDLDAAVASRALVVREVPFLLFDLK
jgi:hypothetical protein